MIASRPWALLGQLALGVSSGGCGRADLYAITRENPAETGTGGGNSVGGGSGRAGAGISGTGGGGSANGDGGGGSPGAGGREVQPAPGDTSGCSTATPPRGDSSVTVQVGTTSRSYVLHVPSTYDGRRPVPLILDFHSIGSSGWGELASSPYPPLTDPEGVIMAFPDGLSGPIGSGWNFGPCCVEDADDLAFARAVVADVKKAACIDPLRIYAVGVLTGGGMAYELACSAASEFAAVAPAAFDLLEENVDSCKPARPITVMSFRGTAASRVPYAGGASSLVPGMPITFLGAQATFEHWGVVNGCLSLPSEADNRGCSSYSGCAAGVEVILCTTQNGGLDPGDPSLAWPVLKRHSL